MYAIVLAAVLQASFATAWLLVRPATAAAECGEVVAIGTHGRSTTRYTIAQPKEPAPGARTTLVLLAGGGGHLDLDAGGCPRALKGNFLVRSLSHFHRQGFSTVLVDAPSDHTGADGLKGFRISAAHADDLGRIVADVRRRVGGPVWMVGNSRGTISAANAASRLKGPAAPDGLVLASAISSGGKGGMRPWAVQTVFDLPLRAIGMPVLVIGHSADQCPRTPARLMNRIVVRTNGTREQVVTLSGGAGGRPTGLAACQGATPHGFLGLEAETVDGIARFIRGGRY